MVALQEAVTLPTFHPTLRPAYHSRLLDWGVWDLLPAPESQWAAQVSTAEDAAHAEIGDPTWKRLVYGKHDWLQHTERWVSAWLPQAAQGRFLEIGGGLCYASALVKRLRPGWHVTATDVSIRYLQHHALRVGEFLEGPADWYAAVDAASLPFEDQQFDRVFSQIVLYRVPRLDQALAEIRRVLRPGGRWLGIERASPWALPWWEAERRWMAERTKMHGWMERPATLRDWQDRLRGLGGTAEYLRPHRRRGWLNAIRAEHVRLELAR